MRLIIFFFLSFSFFFFSCKEKPEQQQETTTTPVSIQEKEFSSFLDSLKQTGATDYQTVNEIRKYVALKLDYGQTRDSLSENYFKIPWKDFSGFYCLELFEQNELTAKCGLTSFVLAKLYDYAGYKNFTYSGGYDVTLSHEFNLVELDGKLILQDAFLDMTIENADGSPKDFIQLLSEIKKGDFSNVKLNKESIVSEYWVDSLKTYGLPAICENSAYRTYITDIDIIDNRVKISLNRSYDFLAGWMLEQMRSRFIEDGFSENFLSIYLKPVYAKNGNSGERADSLLATIFSITSADGQD